ncbi:hypothetical protein CFO_g3727 [Ceratocystis platani]|uniref:Uncharacterized protein n=1 Tax=Ceratocystis fimbriata f. sp. platani TaxID=88771 RepID=A0A0F8DD17_CERFI|nr:hypothetical protein CFO_g3727 [Ceratocystis platani]
MRFPFVESLCLSLSCFKSSSPPSAPSAPSDTAEIENYPLTNPSDPQYLMSHGYAVVERQGVARVYTSRYGLTQDTLYPVLHVFLDVHNQAITIYRNNLHREDSNELSLNLFEIYKALCYRQKIQYDSMQWIAMDIDDPLTVATIQDYRQMPGVGKNDIGVTLGHTDWGTFSENRFYESAVQMIPDAEIDEIIITRQERDIKHTIYPAVIAECIMFSLKQQALEDESTTLDPTEEPPVDLNTKASFNAAVEAAGDASEVDPKAFLEAAEDASEADPKAFPETTEGASEADPKAFPETTEDVSEVDPNAFLEAGPGGGSGVASKAPLGPSLESTESTD